MRNQANIQAAVAMVKAATAAAPPPAADDGGSDGPADSPASTGGADDAAPEQVAADPQGDAETADDATPTSTAAAATPAPEKPPEMPENLRKSWAAVARRDKQLQQRERELKDRERATTDAEGLLKLAKENPIAFAEKVGVRYEDWTQRVLNDGKAGPDEEIRKIREELAEERRQNKAEREATKQADDERRGQAYISELKQGIETDEFELVRHNYTIDDVSSFVIKYNQQTKEVLTPREALTMLEGELEKRVTALLQAKKVKARLAAPAAAPKPAAVSGERQSPRTITNKLTGESPVRKDTRTLTREQRVAEAVKVLKRARRTSEPA